jgi:hypothetical protein
MKHVLFFSFLSMGLLPVTRLPAPVAENIYTADLPDPSSAGKGFNICAQPGPENGNMPAVVFRSQEVCRAELKDFVFDVQFSIVSATVYFSGTNFRGVETGYITSNSLKPIRHFMARCAPGTMVVFDQVKAIGPDKVVRPIAGTSYMLK